MKENKNIKNNLKKYRVWKNLRQVDLAEILGVSTCTLRRIEANCSYPKYQVRAKICNYFNVNQDQMFYFD
jgi:DNA-binding XRE family transcriptional regulator